MLETLPVDHNGSKIGMDTPNCDACHPDPHFILGLVDFRTSLEHPPLDTSANGCIDVVNLL